MKIRIERVDIDDIYQTYIGEWLCLPAIKQKVLLDHISLEEDYQSSIEAWKLDAEKLGCKFEISRDVRELIKRSK